jgi:hypothetical protein
MKRILIAVTLISLIVGPTTRAAEVDSTNTLVWCGLDYSMVKMIGTMDFNQPDKIFPNMLNTWNGLFMKEMFPKLDSIWSPWSSVKSDVKSVYSSNEKASPSQIVREDGSREEMVNATHISEADIAKVVSSYDLKNNQGIGLVFIVDRLVKAQQVGCLYVVYFDIPSRKVLYSERVIAKGDGLGFRNYWFNPIKAAVGKLSKMYKKAEKARANN